VNRSVVVAFAILCGAVSPALAQTGSADGQQAGEGNLDFLSRFDFQVGIEYLVSDDPRFEWDAHWGAELDLVDYGRGAMTFFADYQTIVGDEFREFDPNQGNYMLGGSASVRARAVELAGVFHHVSRHLSDRPKRFPVDWNMVGGRLRTGFAHGRTELRTQVDVRGVIQRSFVDYEWETDGSARAQVRLTPRVAFAATGGVRAVGVDGSRARGTQYGWRTEGAVRFDRPAAALELFVAGERRIDPYQLEFSTATWLTTGFRLVSQ
jgi:hypothetical protein